MWEVSPWPTFESQEPPTAHAATTALGHPPSRDIHRAEQCLSTSVKRRSVAASARQRSPTESSPATPSDPLPPSRPGTIFDTHLSTQAAVPTFRVAVPSGWPLTKHCHGRTARDGGQLQTPRCAGVDWHARILKPAMLNRRALLTTIRPATRIDVDVDRDPATSHQPPAVSRQPSAVSRWLGSHGVARHAFRRRGTHVSGRHSVV
jgi:hypothetical protein